MLPEYDFTGGTRGKHARQYQRGHTVKVHKTDGTTAVQHYKLEDGAVLLAPDVRKYFSDSDSVNDALRTIIKLIPKKRRSGAGE
jgi:predicted peptidase